MSTYDDALARARRVIASVEDWVTETFVEPTLQDLLDALQAGEVEAHAALTDFQRARSLGIDTPSDYVRYDKMRADLFQAQVQVYGVVVTILGRLNITGAVARIPFPTLLPAVLPSSPRAGLRGLGEPITITTGAGIALAIAAVIIAIGVAYILSLTVITVTEELSGVFIAQARAAQFRELLDARLQVYNDCLARAGSSAETCAAAAAQTVPTPLESGTDIPPADGISVSGWVGLGVAGTLLLLFGGWALSRYARSRLSLPGRAMGRVPVRNVAALPSRAPDLDGAKSHYNLEISGPGGFGTLGRTRTTRATKAAKKRAKNKKQRRQRDGDVEG